MRLRNIYAYFKFFVHSLMQKSQNYTSEQEISSWIDYTFTGTHDAVYLHTYSNCSTPDIESTPL